MPKGGAALRRGPGAKRLRRALIGYGFMLPALLLIGLFTLLPFVQGVVLSFQSWDGVGATAFVGLSNYQRVFADNIFWASMVNVAKFGLIGFLLGNALSLALAVAVNANPIGRTFYRNVYYLPGVFSVVVIGMMFQWILQPTVGILNRALGSLGLEALKHNWLANPATALPAVAGVYVWYHWGFGFLLFLAGLQGVPRELYEAASIDGAGAWERFRYVTWPQLIPVTTIVSILTMLAALQIFGTVQVLTNGGPGYHTEVPTLRIYKEAFDFQRFGVAASMSVVFGSILICLSVVQIWVSRRFGSEAD
jgi:multiple sugar transport system permease protein/raffinose/stachyose/melibiose transport system permease protein